jgi:hypothetical protein
MSPSIAHEIFQIASDFSANKVVVDTAADLNSTVAAYATAPEPKFNVVERASKGSRGTEGRTLADWMDGVHTGVVADQQS